jgi:hypothetical protein
VRVPPLPRRLDLLALLRHAPALWAPLLRHAPALWAPLLVLGLHRRRRVRALRRVHANGHRTAMAR